MSTGFAAGTLTANEFLELPDRNRDLTLIRGELWNRPITFRNPFHSAVMMQLGFLLQDWLRSHPDLSLKVLGGEAGFLLRNDPSTVVGIDVAVAQKDQPKYTHKNRVILAGPPLLAAEILSPSDRQREIGLKVDEYLAVGVSLVWILDPHFRTVTVHRAGRLPRMFTEEDHLSGEDILVDFNVSVRQIFETM